MVPAATFVVEQIPYSVAGKVDVRALPDPFVDRVDATTNGVAVDSDRDEVEARVAQVWSSILGIESARIEAHIDFHQLGGDSLSFLTMLAGVCREVLPPATEAEFMSQLGRVIAAPTVNTVAAIAREVLVPDPVA
jgi:acyl carrier protein